MQIIREEKLNFIILEGPVGIKTENIQKISHAIIPEGEAGAGSCTICLHLTGDIPDILIPYDSFEEAKDDLKSLENEVRRSTFQVLNFNKGEN